MLTALGVIIGIVAVTLMGTAIGRIQIGFQEHVVFGDDFSMSKSGLESKWMIVELSRPENDQRLIRRSDLIGCLSHT